MAAKLVLSQSFLKAKNKQEAGTFWLVGLVLGSIGPAWQRHRPEAWQGPSRWVWEVEYPWPRDLVACPGPLSPHVSMSGRRTEGQKARVEGWDLLGVVSVAIGVGTGHRHPLFAGTRVRKVFSRLRV